MNTKELVQEYLIKEGFRPTEEEFGLSFRYEGKTFFFVANNEDNNFFQLALPYIFDVTEENVLAVYKAANAATRDQKVVKTCIFGESVWVFFEILIDSTPELGDIVPRALDMLKAAQQKFYQELQEA